MDDTGTGSASFADLPGLRARLLEAEQRWRELFDDSSDLLLLCHPDGRIAQANPAALHLTGYTAAELTGENVSRLLGHAWDPGGRMPSGGCEIQGRLGRRVWLDVSVQVVLRDGEPTSFQIRGRAVQGAEGTPRSNEERFRSLFETMSQGVIYQDREGRVVSVNPAVGRILGVPVGQVVATTAANSAVMVLDQEGKPLPWEEHPPLVALRTRRPVRNRTLGVLNPERNEIRWVLVDSVPEFLPGEAEPAQVYTILSDITEARRAEAALRDSESEFRTLFESVPVAVLQSTLGGGIIRANPAMLRLMRWDAAERGQPTDVRQFYTSAEQREAILGRLLEEGAVTGVELSLRRADGSPITVLCNAHVVRDGSGRPARFEVVLVDISERKHAHNLVLQIAHGVAATIGAEFFHSLIEHLAQTLGSDCAFVGEALPGLTRNRFVASFGEGCAPAGFEYDLEGTPCGEVVGKGPYLCASGVAGKFSSPITRNSGMEAYGGIPLTDSRGAPLGNIAVMFQRPLEDTELVQSTLEIFAARASAEMERIHAEQELHRSAQRLRAFIANSTEGVWCFEFHQPVPASASVLETMAAVREHGYVAECNDAYARMLGFPCAAEVCGRSLWSLLGEEEWRSMLETAASSPKRGSFISYHVNEQGEEKCYARSATPIIADGRMEQLWGLMVDITDRRKAEMALRESERRFRELLENVQLAAVIRDREGTITFCNEYLLRLAGWSADEVLGRNWFDLFVAEGVRQEAREVYSRRLNGLEPASHREIDLLTRGGATRVIQWDDTLLWTPAGAIAGCASLGRDVTDQRVLEDRYRQSQKLESVGRLAGGIAHDFNNLLTVINGYSDFLLQQVNEFDPLRPGLADIRSAGEKAAALTHQLLAFSRRQVLKPVVLDLNACIADAEKMLRRVIGEDVELVTALEPELCRVQADSGQMHQILMNLAINARDAMPFGGTLRIESANLDVAQSSPPEAAGLAPGRYAAITVSDTGMGMPAEIKSHLFEPFFTTKEPGRGTGLGLSTVYGIVEQSGGHITVQTEPGVGTAFRIYLPESSGPLIEHKDILDPSLNRGTETVLLVEDQPEVRRLVASLLSALGYQVLEAENGERALALAAALQQRIDLLLTDLVMPGMSGVELADRLAAVRPGLHLLYMSGYADRRPGAPTVPEVPVDTLQKPFSSATLARCVREALERG